MSKKAHKIILQAPTAELLAEEGRVIDGIIVVNAKNAEEGSIMFMSNERQMTPSGRQSRSKRPFYINDTIEGLQDTVEEFGLEVDSDYSDVVEPSRLVVSETTKKAYKSHKAKINPESKEILYHDGQVIYRQILLVSKDSPIGDAFLQADAIPEEVVEDATED